MRAGRWPAASLASGVMLAAGVAVGAELAGSWRAETIAGQAVAEGVATTLVVEADGKVAGAGGCNRFFGTVEIAGDRLTFGPLGATRMACPDPQNDQEMRFFAALEAAERFTIDTDGKLLLQGPDGTEPTRLAPAD